MPRGQTVHISPTDHADQQQQARFARSHALEEIVECVKVGEKPAVFLGTGMFEIDAADAEDQCVLAHRGVEDDMKGRQRKS